MPRSGGLPRRGARPRQRHAAQEQPPAPAQPAPRPLPDLRDPRFGLERETLKLVVQQPSLVARYSADLGEHDFTHPTYHAIWEAVSALGGPGAAADAEVWVGKLRDLLESRPAPGTPTPSQVFNALAVEPPRSHGDPDPGVRRGQRVPVAGAHRVAPHRRAQVTPAAHRPRRPRSTTRMFGELMTLENKRRALRDRAMGAVD